MTTMIGRTSDTNRVYPGPLASLCSGMGVRSVASPYRHVRMYPILEPDPGATCAFLAPPHGGMGTAGRCILPARHLRPDAGRRAAGGRGDRVPEDPGLAPRHPAIALRDGGRAVRPRRGAPIHHARRHRAASRSPAGSSLMTPTLAASKAGASAGGRRRPRPLSWLPSRLMEGHPLRMKLTFVKGFRITEIAIWTQQHLSAGTRVRSDGLACFHGVTAAGCAHEKVVVGSGCASVQPPEFRWVSTIPGNIKSALRGTYHAIRPKTATVPAYKWVVPFSGVPGT